MYVFMPEAFKTWEEKMKEPIAQNEYILYQWLSDRI